MWSGWAWTGRVLGARWLSLHCPGHMFVHRHVYSIASAVEEVSLRLMGVCCGLRHRHRQLGMGSFGDVFEGSYRFIGHSTPRPVAVKIFRGSQLLTGSVREQIMIETRITARLSHPHLVRCFGVVKLPDEELALVMELMQGVRALLPVCGMHCTSIAVLLVSIPVVHMLCNWLAS